ncbi:type IV pilus assembly protein PilM [Candidatus Parcubacteria bacterium]|nr:MAG: type IV pilus assembly protein PilM [Candidatus Parcubacteria bacterium]
MAFSFGGIGKALSGVLGKGAEGSILGVDIGASSIKVVQLRASRGAAVLETYGEIALGPYGGQPIGKAVKLSSEKTAEALTDLMKEANVTARKGGISIPFASSLVSVVELPKVDKESLKRIVPIEARKYIPVPITEVALDWFLIPEEEGEQSAFDRMEKESSKPRGQEVLLVAIHNATIENYQALAAEAGITVEFYEIEIFSVVRSSLGHGIAPVLVVDLGAATTKLYVVERGVVRLTHLLTVGGQHMTEVLGRSLNWEFDKAERVKRERGLKDTTAYSTDENERIKTALLSTLTRIFSEVNRVLLSYGQRYNKNVSRVVFTGGGASLPGLFEEAKTSLQADVEIANPFARTEAPAFLGDVLREIGPGFAVAVGLVLRKLKES